MVVIYFKFKLYTCLMPLQSHLPEILCHQNGSSWNPGRNRFGHFSTGMQHQCKQEVHARGKGHVDIPVQYCLLADNGNTGYLK